MNLNDLIIEKKLFPITADVRFKSRTSGYKILTNEEGHNFSDWHDMCNGKHQ